MSAKIYKVISQNIYVEDGLNSVDVKVFTNKDAALKYLHQEIKRAKEDVDDLEDYCVSEDNKSYERYLDGYASLDSVSIWLSEDILDDETVYEAQNNGETLYEIETGILPTLTYNLQGNKEKYQWQKEKYVLDKKKKDLNIV